MDPKYMDPSYSDSSKSPPPVYGISRLGKAPALAAATNLKPEASPTSEPGSE